MDCDAMCAAGCALAAEGVAEEDVVLLHCPQTPYILPEVRSSFLVMCMFIHRCEL